MDVNLDSGRVISGLATLVGYNTENPEGHELECAQFILHEMTAMGCETQVIEFEPGRANVVGVFLNGPGPTFTFNTHIDVVPAGSGWSSDPFRLREEDGLLYGRGSCDAKGPLVAMLEAMRLLIADKHKWSGTLMGVFVGDEEVASHGAKHYIKTAGHIDYAVVGEPTSCTTVTAHKGSIRPIVRVHGKTAHSGMPDLGVNAILKAVPLLEQINKEHHRVRQYEHNLVGSPSLTVVRAKGGHANNIVPDTADFVLDRRMIPGEDPLKVEADLIRMVEEAGKESGVPMEIIDFVEGTGGPTETAADHPIVLASQCVCHHHNKKETPISGFQGGCDLVHLRKAGANGVVIGPGSLAVAHQPNEFVPVKELLNSVLIYRDIAIQMLQGRKPVI